ncbi:MAG: choice-of-anchor Q domain-containing protein, partial [Candidatus Vecturithrix sp.]|nr:choice-of-anchor Q domain-containing protein [Candidatus Vecturithrix sp.]
KDGDVGDCSLRGAVAGAKSGDIITFDPALGSSITIELDQEAIPIETNLSIIGIGPTADRVVIRQTTALANSRHFTVSKGATVTMELLTFENGNPNGYGGALLVKDTNTDLRIRKCTIRNNTTPTGKHAGGVYVGSGAAVTIQQSTFSGNTAAERGGGVYIEGGSARIENCTFSGNNAKYGAAVHVAGSSGNLTMIHCTVTKNTGQVTDETGAIVRTYQGQASLTNNLIIENYYQSPATPAPFDCSNSTAFAGSGNIIGKHKGCGAPIDNTITGLDSTLKNNGGATWTHALLPATTDPVFEGSNAIDRVNRALAVDQRGQPRPEDDLLADVGAYEAEQQGGDLTITIEPSVFLETAGSNAAIATITRDNTTGPLTITLTSSDPTRATVEGLAYMSLVMAEGESTKTFNIYAEVDPDDVNNTVTFTATTNKPSLYEAVATDVIVAEGLVLIIVPDSFSENGGSATGTVYRPGTTSGALTVTLTSSDTTEATVPTTVTIPDGQDSVEFIVTGVDDYDEDGNQVVTITASAIGFNGDTADVTVLDDESPTPTPTTSPTTVPTPDITGKQFWTDGLGSHAFPTYLFTASYDWLHNFNDRNEKATRGAKQVDPDTDNFNKIMVADSNLFPIITAVAGDFEFPNITSRNTALHNDYFTRSVAAAPNFLHDWNLPYYVSRDDNKAYHTGHYDLKGVEQYGARSMVEWVFVTDPGNHNIRRYEMRKIGDFWTSLEPGDELLGDFGGMLDGGDLSGSGVGQGDCSTCAQNSWYMASLEDIFSKNTNSLTSAKNTYNSNSVYYFNRDSGYTHPTTPAGWREDGKQEGSGVLEFIITIPADAMPLSNWKLDVGGNSDDQSAPTLFVGVNARYEGGSPVDPPFNDAGYTPPSGYPAQPEIAYCDLCPGGTCSQPKVCAYENVGPSQGKDTQSYTFSKIDASYDLDPTRDGIQVRISIFPTGNGGFILEGIQTDESDSAFAVKRDPSDTSPGAIEARWNKLDMYLETVPPESAPAYASYADPATRAVGYGAATNTSFTTASNVRFKNPRDLAVFRDVFDTRTSLTDKDNGAPVYLFVADTMNSRIQVFMNATGSAGETGADFPVRPVRVKGPNDNSAATSHNSNELALRLYDGSGNSSGFGDGRKADWRPFINPNPGFKNITQGIGEFYYPHGVAVDQDPDTKDVYLFVADTFNHRIQVFRDVSGVTSQAITNKRFDFQYEKGWGAYPANEARPGGFSLKYPKGLDVARFANNSSYLYVVDSKNYRVLKYLLTEQGDGGLNDPEIVAGFGFDGTTFSRSLTSLPGQPIKAHQAFEESGVGLEAVGFLNPQDITTGYSGFYTYSGPMQVSGKHYPYELDRGTGRTKRGIRYLNNYMVYVTDYARNHTSITRDRLNMRVMQFADNYKTFTGVFLPWATAATPTFTKGALWQSPFGPKIATIREVEGRYNSDGGGALPSTGSTENVPGRTGYFTDRPVGIDAMTWDTITPFDMRVADIAGGTLYPNGASISKTKTLRVGVTARAFFELPYGTITNYTNYTSQKYLVDGKGVKRMHAFCYDLTGKYVGYVVDDKPPFIFAPNGTTVANGVQRPAACGAGYLKLIAEDKHFTYSGKTGTMIFQLTN